MMREFHEMLEDLRKARKMSKTDLAKSAGVTIGYVSHLTRGERTTPSQSAVEALANALRLEGDIRVQFFDAAGHTLNVPSTITSKEDHEEFPRVSSFWGREKELT